MKAHQREFYKAINPFLQRYLENSIHVSHSFDAPNRGIGMFRVVWQPRQPMNAINFLSMEVRWVGFKYFGGHGRHVATSTGPEAHSLDSSEGTWATERQQRPGTETTVLPIYVFRPFFLCRVLVVSLVFLSIAEAERTLLITDG